MDNKKENEKKNQGKKVYVRLFFILMPLGVYRFMSEKALQGGDELGNFIG